ncbi:M20 family metallopeptidase [Ruania zhangjianzhongii]|uniref:M20 family metallopeptidase n=1 Tax=Ruania zhangjianzhongii TaxID=2603206 RepID=UPI0011C84E1D|nr:M20/M25/M40 family metallo-hydrolase [Ruania zhangjianzhongii]
MTALTVPAGIDHAAVTQLLAELIEIPSVNPAYDAASPGENMLGDAVGELCRSFGCTVTTTDVVDGRRNTLARLTSATSEKSLLIEAHLDTVSLPTARTNDRQLDMSRAEVRGDRMYGRGACDVKGGLTAALLAMQQLAAQPLRSLDVVLLGAIDEEYQFRGVTSYIAEHLTDQHGPNAAIVLEPTQLQVVHEHHGVLRVEIGITGRAAHTSRPEEGRNAILGALRVIDHLEAWNDRSGGRIMAVTTVSGGTAINIVPESCAFGVDLRVLPWEDPHEVLATMVEEINDRAGDGLSVTVTQLLLDAGMATPAQTPIVRAALRSGGEDEAPARVPFGTDGSKLARAGVPTIVFGPGSIDQAHADDEWVDLRDVTMAAERIVAIARSLDAEDLHAPITSSGAP